MEYNREKDKLVIDLDRVKTCPDKGITTDQTGKKINLNCKKMIVFTGTNINIDNNLFLSVFSSLLEGPPYICVFRISDFSDNLSTIIGLSKKFHSHFGRGIYPTINKWDKTIFIFATKNGYEKARLSFDRSRNGIFYNYEDPIEGTKDNYHFKLSSTFYIYKNISAIEYYY